MNYKIIFPIIILSIILSCKGTEQAISNDTQIEKASTQLSPMFTVTFYSEGEGIEWAAVPIFDDFISIYSSENETQLNYELISWGREGEIDYCFNLSSIEEDKRGDFISEVKKTLENYRLIQYQENQPCKNLDR